MFPQWNINPHFFIQSNDRRDYRLSWIPPAFSQLFSCC